MKFLGPDARISDLIDTAEELVVPDPLGLRTLEDLVNTSEPDLTLHFSDEELDAMESAHAEGSYA